MTTPTAPRPCAARPAPARPAARQEPPPPPVRPVPVMCPRLTGNVQYYLANEFAPRDARGHVRAEFARWRAAGDPSPAEFAEAAEQIVSELVTNAVRNCHGHQVEVRLTRSGRSLAIQVWDDSPAPPVPRNAGPEDPGGRGLAIVRALSRQTGWYATLGGGKVVWAECALETPDCIPGSAGRNLEDIPGSMALPGAERQWGP